MLVAHLPPQVEMAREALQQAGFRPVGHVQEIGDHAWIECLPSADTGSQGSTSGVAGRASQALRRCGFDVSPEHIVVMEAAGRVLIRVPVRVAPRRTYEPNAEMLTFRLLPGGGIRAETPFSKDALLNTRDEFVRCLEDVRVLVRKEKKISASDLAGRFAGTVLVSAAAPSHWEEWRDGFAKDLTAKNAALVLLGDTTALKLASLETRLSEARTGRTFHKTVKK